MQLLHAVLFAYLIVKCTVGALRLDLYGQRQLQKARIGRRASGIRLNNSADVSYYANLRIGGKVFSLLVDTGSSDLWIAGEIPDSKSTGLSSGISYAVGSVEGPINIAEVELGGYTIPDQAFLQVSPDQDNKEGDGIIGLGPNSGSKIYQEVGTAAGAAMLDHIFLQNRTLPNYLTVLLDRSIDPTDSHSGSLTIGEVLNSFEAVLQEPKLPVISHKEGDPHFQVLLDNNGLIGPDGNVISLRTSVSTTLAKGQLTVVLDTGFSLPQIPESAASAIYGKFSGAELINIGTIGDVWIVPCSQEVNITFKFAGKSYPIHPLDTTLDPHIIGLTNLVNSKGQDSCIGAFQPFSYDTGSSPSYDMVLGMAFLRNVYMLMNYGDFIVGTMDENNPYIQFFSTTDPTEAHADFVKIRLNGKDTTSETGLTNSKNSSAIRRKLCYILVPIAGVEVLAGVVYFIYRRKRNYAGASMTTGALPPILYTSGQYPGPQINTYSGAVLSHGHPPYITQPELLYHPQQTLYNSSHYSQNSQNYPHYPSHNQ